MQSVCQQCGRPVAASQAFCGGCGTKLNREGLDEPTERIDEHRPRTSSRWSPVGGSLPYTVGAGAASRMSYTTIPAPSHMAGTQTLPGEAQTGPLPGSSGRPASSPATSRWAGSPAPVASRPGVPGSDWRRVDVSASSQETIPVPGSHVPEKRTFSRRATLRALAGLSVLAAAGLGAGLVIISQNKAGAGTGTLSSHPRPALRATATYTYAGHRSPVYGVVWEPTTQAGRSMLRVASAGRDVQLWDALNGGNSKIYNVYQGEVFSLAWCHSTTKIVSGNLDGTAHIWTAATAQYVNRLIGHSAAIRGVAWARDGVHIATASNDMRVGLWTLDTQHNDAASPIFLQNHGNIVYAVSFSDDSSYLASSSADRTVLLWQVPGGAHLATYTGHTGDVRAVAFAPGSSRSAGLLIASGGEDKTAQVWTWSAQSQAFHLLARYAGHNATINTLAWSPAGSLIASGDNMGQVHIWLSKTAERLLTFQAHRDAVNGLAWSPDGRYLASAGQDQLVHVFRVS